MRASAATVLFLASLLLSQPVFAGMRVVVMDAGRGQAVLLIRGSRGLLMDSGVAPFAETLLARIQAHGVDDLDYFMVSHLHPDHVGGYFRIRERYPEAGIIGNGHPLADRRRSSIEHLYDAALRRDPRFRVMAAGDELTWRGVVIKVLWPAAFADQNLNRHSLVLDVSYGKSRMLVMGDAGEIVERRLLEQGALQGPVSVLISGHHGLGNSADARFLARLRPRVAVIAASWRVPRFQPDDAVAARLEAASDRLLRTDEDGEICLELSADSLAPEDC